MVDNVEDLSAHLDSVTLSTTWPEVQTWSEGILLRQLKTVSKLMASSTAREAEREFFYVELGGFDTHNEPWEELKHFKIAAEDMDEALAALLAQMDRAVDVFVEELKAQARVEHWAVR